MFEFFLISSILALLVYWLVRGRRTSPRRGVNRAGASQRQTSSRPAVERHASYPFIDVPTLMERGDWDGARRALQKMAYEFVSKPANEKREFTALMVEFAKLDPLYNRCIKAVFPLVQAQPGIRQTALYPHMPTADIEESRYVLYFAHELGHLVRIKKGNSYQVYLPGQTIPDAETKAKRAVN